jgi:acetoin utilization deacetylase AcuC-like enzyme
MKVATIYDPIYLEHHTGLHVENAGRLEAIMGRLTETGLINRLRLTAPRPATVDEVAMVHSREYISYVELLADKGGGWIDGDTVVSPASYRVALMAAGGACRAVERVMDGEVDASFALVRPPGHHSGCWNGMGFCLFNNVAIAARFALANYNIERVLIVDFDVHHGNGTQDTFYADRHVLYFSTHQHPFYPGSGSMAEVGVGAGQGYTVNVPMLAGWGDEEYVEVYREVLWPVAQRFKPQLIMVSAGYDAHWADSISQMKLSATGYADMVFHLRNMAQKLSLGRIVFVLEGGYHHDALAASVKATMDMLLENRGIDDPMGPYAGGRKTEGFADFLNLVKSNQHIGRT